MDDVNRAEIIDTLVQVITALVPDANLRPMYGGTVIELETDNPKSRIGGVYGYADYVSLEFAKGATFDDPGGVLEGSGKSRRHVKLRSVEDVTAKTCAQLLRKAISSSWGA